jgi:hypothetical protein
VIDADADSEALPVTDGEAVSLCVNRGRGGGNEAQQVSAAVVKTVSALVHHQYEGASDRKPPPTDVWLEVGVILAVSDDDGVSDAVCRV